MFFNRNKFNKLKREDVVNAICDLEKEEQAIEARIQSDAKVIADLMAKGRKETDRDLKLLYAKKINHMQEERKDEINRAMYLLYNIKLMNKLKSAMDDNSTYINAGKVSLENLLADQTNLAKFLNKALNTKIKAENVLTSADETFCEIKEMYDPNQAIYGVSKSDDEMLAIFETDGAANDFAEVAEEENTAHANKDTLDTEGE